MEENMQVRTHTTEQTIALGRVLGAAARPDSCIVLCGDLGAGKTQLTKGIAAGLGSADAVTSPTFTIVAEYPDGRLPLFHFDLYRLEEPDELVDIGYDDLLEAGGICAIEWGDRFPEMLPDDRLVITITLDDATGRTLRCEAAGPRSEHLLAALEAAGDIVPDSAGDDA
jgi:tRNA threonylcarbamoyladenosine biosynthesis protein TsaE